MNVTRIRKPLIGCQVKTIGSYQENENSNLVTSG